MRAWSLLTIPIDERTHRGNEGYEDVLSRSYDYDSTVPNSRYVLKGDLVLVRNRKNGLGVSIIDSIERRAGTKARHRCPEPGCGSTDIKERKTIVPLHRCGVCLSEFDDPRTEMIKITAYRANYESRWQRLRPSPSIHEFEGAYLNRAQQHAIRELELNMLVNYLDLGPFGTGVQVSKT